MKSLTNQEILNKVKEHPSDDIESETVEFKGYKDGN